MTIIICLMTFDTLRVMFAVDWGSDLYTGLSVFIFCGLGLDSLCVRV